jgi:hypothetical protein
MAQSTTSPASPTPEFVLLTDRAGHSAILPLEEAFDALIVPPLVTTRRQAVDARRSTATTTWVVERIVGHILKRSAASQRRLRRWPP